MTAVGDIPPGRPAQRAEMASLIASAASPGGARLIRASITVLVFLLEITSPHADEGEAYQGNSRARWSRLSSVSPWRSIAE